MKEISNRIETINKLKQLKNTPLNVLGILENTNNQAYEDSETGSLWIENKYFNYICGDEAVIKAQIKQHEDGFYGFAAVSSELAESIYKDHLLHWLEPTDQYVFSGSLSDEDNPYLIESVKIEEAEGINERYEYKNEDSLERIKDAINNRPSSAIRLEGKLASYVLVHEDNSIGYMYTLSEYRHMGLGYWVTLDILKKMRNRGSVPFVEITAQNFKSQGLAQKTGFIKTKFTPWFGIIKGCPDELKMTGNNLTGNWMFTTIAHLKYVVPPSINVVKVQIEKAIDGYLVKLENEAFKAEVQLKWDETIEAHIVLVVDNNGFTTTEIIKQIVQHLSEYNGGLLIPYEAEGLKLLGCIKV